MTWITIVSVVIYQGVIVFGAAAQSNLLMVSSNQLGTNISATGTAGATLSVLLLLASGVAMLKTPKLGVPIAALGLAAYLVPFYPAFGSDILGLQQTFISPGIGLFVAGTGIGLGSISSLTKPESAGSLTHSLRTRQGLSKLGASLGAVGLTLDVANHTALGQLPDFIGSTPVEQTLHLGLVAGVGSILVVTALGSRLGSQRYLFALSAATLLLLGIDSASSLTTGNLHDFLGHNLTETLLHLSVYYGVALTTIAGLIHRTSSLPRQA